jgi:hypothetical protein
MRDRVVRANVGGFGQTEQEIAMCIRREGKNATTQLDLGFKWLQTSVPVSGRLESRRNWQAGKPALRNVWTAVF